MYKPMNQSYIQFVKGQFLMHLVKLSQYQQLQLNWMEKELSCMICNQQYSIDNPPRLIPVCGHSLCECCIKKLFQDQSNEEHTLKCPEDNEIYQFKQHNLNLFPKNFALIKLLSVKKENQSSFGHSLNESNITNKIPVPDDQQDGELIKVINESTKETQKTSKSEKSINLNLDQLCLIHQKPLEIICIKCRTKICATCAIFGEHKGHDFKSVQEVQKDKIIACDDILHIIQKKQTLQLKLTSPEIKDKHSKQLQAKKQILTKQIKDNFSRLYDIIVLSEKKAVEKLSKLFEFLEVQVAGLGFPQKINRKYEQWEQQAFKYIKAFESNDLEQQIPLLNYQKKDEQDVVQNGLQVLKELEDQCEKIQNKAQQIIRDSILIQFKPDIDIRISQCCLITTKQQKEKELEKQKQINTVPNRLKSQDARMQRVDPTTNSKDRVSRSSRQFQIQKMQVKQQRKVSDHNDDMLIDDQKLQDPDTILESNIEIPIVVSLHSLDTSGSDAPVKTNENRRLQFSPIRKENGLNESMNNSFLKNIGGKKPPVSARSGNVLPSPASKRRSKLKLPQKYEKVYEAIIADSTEIADFTNAQLGDQVISQILQSLKGKKVKTLKLIRNKLTDQGMDKLWNYLENIITLNLSQNLLSDRFVDQLLHNLPKLPNLRSVILSQNKIKQRNVKIRLQQIKKHEITVSI